jgi:hypothetical protein
MTKGSEPARSPSSFSNTLASGDYLQLDGMYLTGLPEQAQVTIPAEFMVPITVMLEGPVSAAP